MANIFYRSGIIIIIGMQESPGLQSPSILQTMTMAMKQFKQILHQFESELKQLIADKNNKDHKIEQLIAGLLKSVAIIQSSQCKKMLCNRLISRVVEIATIYRNKFGMTQSMYSMRDHLTAVIGLIQQYQHVHHGAQPPPKNQYNIQFINLFQKICHILKRALAQLRQRLGKLNLFISTIPMPIVSNNGDSTNTNKQKQRRNSISQPPMIKSMENKYKLTKQVINNVSLFVGMEVDVSYLRGLFLQARCNLADVQEDKIDNNCQTIKARDMYMESYHQWRTKVQKRMSRKQRNAKMNQSSPNKKNNKNSENKGLLSGQKNSSLMAKTSTKMPKIFYSSQLSNNYLEGDRKRQQFKNMQALTFNRQFIHLSQIKNQKIARRPYAEVKQVLVAGDQLNYYSHKNPQNSYVQPSKASFFMQRAVKNEKIIIRKKSYVDSTRLATQE